MTENKCSGMLFCIKMCRKYFCRIFKLHVVLLTKKIKDDHLTVYLVLAMSTSVIIFSMLWSVPLLKLFLLFEIHTYRCVYVTTC